MQDFTNKIAVVTGGGTGMGRELVCQLIGAGAHVAMCDVAPENMAETQRLASALGTGRLTSHLCDVSREGVQRDLLPLIEGCTVSTKHGMVKTDHILFVASGAFHLARPSDLIPELQGRLPIRVELAALTPHDFERILTEPNASLTVQYKALMKTEGLDIDFTADGIKRLAEIAYQVNESTENIGARRLHTLMERLLESVSFDATDLTEQVIIDGAYVDQKLGALAQDQDLSKFIL